MLIVLCGYPGSGKTTLSNQLAELYSACVYHYDEWHCDLKRLGGDKARNQMYLDIRNDLLNGIDVVVDDLNLHKYSRLKLLSHMRDVQCDKFLIVLKTPVDVCIIRNRQRDMKLPDSSIYAAEKQFENPALDEGWDSIIYYEGE